MVKNNVYWQLYFFFCVYRGLKGSVFYFQIFVIILHGVSCISEISLIRAIMNEIYLARRQEDCFWKLKLYDTLSFFDHYSKGHLFHIFTTNDKIITTIPILIQLLCFIAKTSVFYRWYMYIILNYIYKSTCFINYLLKILAFSYILYFNTSKQ